MWSLILGICGLVCVELIAVVAAIPVMLNADVTGPEVKLGLIMVGLCSGVLAIVTAHVVIPKLRKEAPIFKEHGFAIAGLITGYMAIAFQLGILATLFLTSFALLRSEARDTECISNLRELYLGCKLYAEDHEGQLPKSVSELKSYVCPETGTATSVFICPLAKDKAGPSYELAVTGKLAEVNHPDQTVLIRENSGRHRKGRFAVYADGHVESLLE